MLPHEVDNLWRVDRSQAVVDIKFYASLPAQVVDGLAVFAAAECQKIPLRRFEGAEPVDGNLHFIPPAEERFLHQHGDIT